MYVDMRDFPGRVNQAQPFVVGKLSIPLVLYPICTCSLSFLPTVRWRTSSGVVVTNRKVDQSRTKGKFEFTPLTLFRAAAAALAFFGLVAAIMGNSHLLILNAQGATLFGQASMIIMFILYLRTDQQIREAHRGLTGGLGNAIWMGLVASLISGIALLFGLMSTAEETRKNGSLIKKEVYV